MFNLNNIFIYISNIIVIFLLLLISNSISVYLINLYYLFLLLENMVCYILNIILININAYINQKKCL